MKYINKILLSISLVVCLFVQKMKALFCNTENEGKMYFEQGEITVVGEYEAEILLRKEPCEVVVELVEDHVHVPCDPHHHHDHGHGHHHHHKDTVDWYIKRHRKHSKHKSNYVLKIEWKVSGARTIRWSIKY